MENIVKEYNNYICTNHHLIDLNVYQFGYMRCLPNDTQELSCQHYLFVYVFDGYAQISLTSDQKTEMQPVISHVFVSSCQGILIPPNYRLLYQADSLQPWYYGWIEFTGFQAENYIKSAGLSPSSPILKPSTMFTPPHDNPVSRHMLDLVRQKAPSQPYIIGTVYRIFDDLITVSSSKKQANGTEHKYANSYVNALVSYIEQHYAQDISVASLAQYCGLNRSYMTKIFKQATGSSVQEYILKCRFENACNLLENSSLSIAEIAAKTGFSDQMHFSKIFRKYIGTTPTDWRKTKK